MNIWKINYSHITQKIMVQIGSLKFFTENDIDQRNQTIQRIINLMTDAEKFETFNNDLNHFLDIFEEFHGKNEKIKNHA